MFPSGDESADLNAHKPAGIFWEFFGFLSGTPISFLSKMWFYGDFHPNKDARAFLAFIETYLTENLHLMESQKCETLYNHLYLGWEADDWYEELESSAPEVLTSWSMLHNHFHVKWLGASPSTLFKIPKCNPPIICTATTIPHESTTSQA